MKYRSRPSRQTSPPMQPRTRKLLIGGAALVIALSLPAIAQDRPESLLPPGFGDPSTPAPQPVANETQPAAPSRPQPSAVEDRTVEVEDLLGAMEEMAQAERVPQVEYPARARRDPRLAGTLDPASIGLGDRAWDAASGKAMQIVMRRMDTPLASRWAHIGLRKLLLAQTPSPAEVHSVDWAAERAWL